MFFLFQLGKKKKKSLEKISNGQKNEMITMYTRDLPESSCLGFYNGSGKAKLIPRGPTGVIRGIHLLTVSR